VALSTPSTPGNRRFGFEKVYLRGVYIPAPQLLDGHTNCVVRANYILRARVKTSPERGFPQE